MTLDDLRRQPQSREVQHESELSSVIGATFANVITYLSSLSAPQAKSVGAMSGLLIGALANAQTNRIPPISDSGPIFNAFVAGSTFAGGAIDLAKQNSTPLMALAVMGMAALNLQQRPEQFATDSVDLMTSAAFGAFNAAASEASKPLYGFLATYVLLGAYQKAPSRNEVIDGLQNAAQGVRNWTQRVLGWGGEHAAEVQHQR